MQKTMQAAVLDRPFSLEVKQISMPAPKKDEALVQVYCIGICGSDVHYYEHGKIGRYEVKQPIILGHELAGVVVQIGDEVTNVAVGDRVAVEPGVTCGRCEYCKSGRYNLCPDVQFMATPPVDGAWAEYVAVRSDFLYKLPDDMSFEEGALLEPLSVGYYAMRRAQVSPQDRVLVTGLGPIGLLAMQAAKLFGVSEIYGSDVVVFRRELALKMGATAVLDPLAGNLNDQLQSVLGDKPIDVIIESSGNARAISQTISLIKPGGRIVYIGLPTAAEVPLDISTLIDKDLNIYGLFRYANTYPAAIQALSRSNQDIRQVITHQFSLSQIKEAIELARTDKETGIKVMIYPQQ